MPKRKARLFALLFCVSVTLSAQDTTKVPLLNHEIGINAETLLQQLRVFVTPAGIQQPYVVFYNLYFKDMAGVRGGIGMSNIKSETDIDGQPKPRVNTQKEIHFRAGATYNFVRTKKFTFNVFADYLHSEASSETVNSFTVPSFPDVISVTSEITEKGTANGGQVGIGVKWNITKHLALYTEMPVSYVRSRFQSEDRIRQTGQPTFKESSESEATSTSIALPVTIYLVLRF